MLRFTHSYSLPCISCVGFNTPLAFSHSYSYAIHTLSSFSQSYSLSHSSFSNFFPHPCPCSYTPALVPTPLTRCSISSLFPLLLFISYSYTSQVHTSHSHASAFTIAPALVRTLILSCSPFFCRLSHTQTLVLTRLLTFAYFCSRSNTQAFVRTFLLSLAHLSSPSHACAIAHTF